VETLWGIWAEFEGKRIQGQLQRGKYCGGRNTLFLVLKEKAGSDQGNLGQ
jgi:hypothetical protein